MGQNPDIFLFSSLSYPLREKKQGYELTMLLVSISLCFSVQLLNHSIDFHEKLYASHATDCHVKAVTLTKIVNNFMKKVLTPEVEIQYWYLSYFPEIRYDSKAESKVQGFCRYFYLQGDSKKRSLFWEVIAYVIV